MWHSPENTFPATVQANTLCDEFESYTFKITATASNENNELNHQCQSDGHQTQI